MGNQSAIQGSKSDVWGETSAIILMIAGSIHLLLLFDLGFHMSNPVIQYLPDPSGMYHKGACVEVP